ncbi:molybdopterin synthase sulfur carrier subunit [Parashewanella curva]|uniref:Molybdopterin synthase sulfur carrier subunit n=1 Tax=Parashewanella curva TaxID=2338552 RepID=A0A3L8PZZ3_9GAMM|nr:molybdopterin synthase sulfur carrier subunit [Parashewanella curva]RLV60740.1 molybdopterin synthase sulfur carrier subunit [Parashewanella curva]
MITVLFFAQVRERLGCAQIEVPFNDEVTTAESLRQHLAQRDEKWQQVLIADKLLVAVDQTMCDWQTPLTDNSEVAFFPPVTGG